ncbi:MAG: O-antigen ligase family protein [Bacteroidia bacterium]|nr:O-antigen ligase family protein [Bacteroidia bacterium]
MAPLRKDIHSGIFFFGLLLITAGLPLSKFLMSLSFMLLAGNWLLEGLFREKWSRFREFPTLWLLLGFYLLHFPVLIWTSDLQGWYADARVKFPLFLLPLIIGTSTPLSGVQWKWLLRCFTAAVVLKSLIGMGIYLRLWGQAYADVREITGSLSHIRFSLMLCLNILLLYFMEFRGAGIRKKLVTIAICLWMLVMLVLLRNLTGMMILGTCGLILFLLYLFRSGKNKITWGIGTLVLACIVFAGWRTHDVYTTWFIPKHTEILPGAVSAGGEIYIHDSSMNALENGYRLGEYIAWTELQLAWNDRSVISYNGKDRRGHELRFTLLRFLTSKGLRKDAASIGTLTRSEIAAIEDGIANVVYLTEDPITCRIHQVLWELNDYTSGGADPSGHSVTQRFEFWKAAMYCWKMNFWIGTGPGDVEACMQEAYTAINSPLNKENRLRPHNQYLSVAAGMGLFGLCAFLGMLLIPLFLRRHRKILYFIFVAMMAMSMLTEDTLETQVGVTLFALFSSLLLFHFPQTKEE